jgi:jumonji domain-containing protein 7
MLDVLAASTMRELLIRLKDDSPVAYLQSQNSNLTADSGSGDFSPLLQDLMIYNDDGKRITSLPWADEAIGKQPDATNLWIGTEKSRTSMHRDHYENLFTVLRGVKVFTLYPPSEAYFLCEGESNAGPPNGLGAYLSVADLPYEVYQWSLQDGQWEMKPSESPPTPWIPIDPTEPANSKRNSKFPRFAKALPPLVVEVHEGDTLYLPAG